jgi:hypothetical protein
MAMKYEDLKGPDVWRYAIVYPPDHFDKIYAAEQEIKKEVAGLRDAHQLSEDAVLTTIEKALKTHAADDEVKRSFQHLYMRDDEVGPVEVRYVGGRVHKFDVIEGALGFRVALLFNNSWNRSQAVSICEETSRRKWHLIKNIEGLNVENIYLIDGGKKLAMLDDQDNVSFENLDATNDNLDHETLMEECRKKRAENYADFISGGIKERNVMEDSWSFCVNTHTPEKYIKIERDGFRAYYEPTLEEIAQYFLSKYTSEASTQSLEDTKK